MRTLKKLLSANSGENVAAKGKFIWMKSCTGEVYVKTSSGESAFLQSGEFCEFDKVYDSLFIEDQSGSQNSLTFVIAENGEAGRYGTIDISLPQTIEEGSDVTITSGSAQLIAAADSERVEILIVAKSTNTAPARFGSATVGAASGVPISADETLVLNSAAAVYAYCTASATFHILEVKR